MLQMQNMPSITPNIETFRFHIVIQSKTGYLFFEDCLAKPPRFMERVYAELAMRHPRDEIILPEYKKMRLYQTFSPNENVFAQVFVNTDPTNLWIQKIRPIMNNVELVGVKNQKKPVDIRIEPNQEKILLAQQIDGKDFQFVGGQGDYLIQAVSKI